MRSGGPKASRSRHADRRALMRRRDPITSAEKKVWRATIASGNFVFPGEGAGKAAFRVHKAKDGAGTRTHREGWDYGFVL